MATTCFFEETVSDKGDAKVTMEVGFGRSSFYGENLIYITVDGNSVILDERTGRALCDRMRDLGDYLGYGKD